MIPINSKYLKEQEDVRPRQFKEPELKIHHMTLQEYHPHVQNPLDNYMEPAYFKGQAEGPESQHYMHYHYEDYADRCPNLENAYMPENPYDPHAYAYKGGWLVNNAYEDFFSHKIKHEYDEPKAWQPQIKDEESPSANNDQAFQPCEVPKQQETHNARYTIEDPNKFFGVCVSSAREEKNLLRRLKVQAYLKKKKLRSFEKKIIYKCRKQVADNRIRYRGRFISLTQAAEILGLDPNGTYSTAELGSRFKALSSVDSAKQKSIPVKQEYVYKFQREDGQ